MTGLTSTADSSNVTAKNRYVLLVDNNKDDLSSLIILLEWFKYKAFTTNGGSDTLSAASAVMPSVVIISVSCQDFSGFELMNRLKHNPSTSHIPFIGFMMHEDVKIKTKCYQQGAVGYLYQPLDVEMVYRVLQSAVEKKPRTSMRIKAVHPVKIGGTTNNILYAAKTLDISDQGVFLKTDTPEPVNTDIFLQLDIEGRTILTEARVLYSCDRGQGPHNERGMGLKFTNISQSDKAYIRQFVIHEVMKNVALKKSYHESSLVKNHDI